MPSSPIWRSSTVSCRVHPRRQRRPSETEEGRSLAAGRPRWPCSSRTALPCAGGDSSRTARHFSISARTRAQRFRAARCAMCSRFVAGSRRSNSRTRTSASPQSTRGGREDTHTAGGGAAHGGARSSRPRARCMPRGSPGNAAAGRPRGIVGTATGVRPSRPAGTRRAPAWPIARDRPLEQVFYHSHDRVRRPHPCEG